MTVDVEAVKNIAFLSRLKIEEENVEATKDEFNKIMAWVDTLREVDTENVEPLISVNENNIALRKDEVIAGNCAKEILANAPMQEYGYFAVPKVIE